MSSSLANRDRSEFTYNKNVHITKDIYNTNRYIDDADVIRAQNEARDTKSSLWILLGLALIPIIICIFTLLIPSLENQADAQKGMITAGYSSSLVGENYQTVVAHFEAAGFTDIQVIDLNDAGLAFWNDNKVSTISIGGDTYFDENDYYWPNTRVVISYH